MISRDLVGTFSQRRMRRATSVRLKFNYKTIFEASSSIPLCGQISRVWLGCVRAQGHGSIASPSCQPRERHSSRRKCSYPASRIVAMGSSVSRAMIGWNNFCNIFYIGNLVFFFLRKYSLCFLLLYLVVLFYGFFLWLFFLIIRIEGE